MKYNEFEVLEEGIEDKGLFKAVFLAGSPGAGKSTVAAKITDGAIAPRMVNSDRAFEFLAKQAGMSLNSGEASAVAWALFGRDTERISMTALFNYLNGMLPLFVDSTSSNPSATLRRVGLLESLGYDISMVWVSVSLETALERINGRERKVDPKFVARVHETMDKNKSFYALKFGSDFTEVSNEGDDFDAIEGQTFNAATRFFTTPPSNPTGQQNLAKLQESNEKYLTPTIYPVEYLKKMTDIWYMT